MLPVDEANRISDEVVALFMRETSHGIEPIVLATAICLACMGVLDGTHGIAEVDRVKDSCRDMVNAIVRSGALGGANKDCSITFSEEPSGNDPRTPHKVH